MGSGKEGPPQRGLKEGAVGVGGFSEGSWLTLAITLSRKSAMGWNGHWEGGEGSVAPLHLNTGVCLPGGCVQLGGLQEHKDPALVENQLPMVAPPWGYYLQGPGQKRPFQPSTSCNRN